MTDHRYRRAFLRGAGVAGLAALGGCLDDALPFGDRERDPPELDGAALAAVAARDAPRVPDTAPVDVSVDHLSVGDVARPRGGRVGAVVALSVGDPERGHPNRDPRGADARRRGARRRGSHSLTPRDDGTPPPSPASRSRRGRRVGGRRGNTDPVGRRIPTASHPRPRVDVPRAVALPRRRSREGGSAVRDRRGALARRRETGRPRRPAPRRRARRGAGRRRPRGRGRDRGGGRRRRRPPVRPTPCVSRRRAGPPSAPRDGDRLTLGDPRRPIRVVSRRRGPPGEPRRPGREQGSRGRTPRVGVPPCRGWTRRRRTPPLERTARRRGAPGPLVAREPSGVRARQAARRGGCRLRHRLGRRRSVDADGGDRGREVGTPWTRGLTTDRLAELVGWLHAIDDRLRELGADPTAPRVGREAVPYVLVAATARSVPAATETVVSTLSSAAG